MNAKNRAGKSKGTGNKKPVSLLELGVTFDFPGGCDFPGGSDRDRLTDSTGVRQCCRDHCRDAGLDALKIKPPDYPSLF